MTMCVLRNFYPRMYVVKSTNMLQKVCCLILGIAQIAICYISLVSCRTILIWKKNTQKDDILSLFLFTLNATIVIDYNKALFYYLPSPIVEIYERRE